MVVHIYIPGIQEAEYEGQASLGYNVWSIFKKRKILFRSSGFSNQDFYTAPVFLLIFVSALIMKMKAHL